MAAASDPESPEEPEQDSDLAEDDKPFADQRISEMVRISLISACEHLRLVWDPRTPQSVHHGPTHRCSWRAGWRGTGRLDHGTRRPRHAAAPWSRGDRGIVQATSEVPRAHARPNLTQDQKQQVRDQVEWIRSRQQALVAVQPQPMQVNLTDVLLAIAPVVFPGNPLRQSGLRVGWNVLSSDAHVLMWGISTRAAFSRAWPADRNSGLSTGGAGGQLREPAGWHDLIMHSLRRGWSLFDRRCEGK